MRVPGCRVSTSDATQKTVHGRSKQLSQIREVISGGESHLQLQDEIHVLPKEERQRILREGGFYLEIPPEQGLAMKAHLALPWHKLRQVRR